MLNAFKILATAGESATQTSQLRASSLLDSIQQIQGQISQYEREVNGLDTEIQELSKNRLRNAMKLATLSRQVIDKKRELEIHLNTRDASDAELAQIQKEIDLIESEYQELIAPFKNQSSLLESAISLFDLDRITNIARIVESKETLSYRLIIDSIIDQLIAIPEIKELLELLDKQDATPSDFIRMEEIILRWGGENFQNFLVLILQEKDKLIEFVDTNITQEDLRNLVINEILVVKDIERFINIIYPKETQTEPEFEIEQLPQFFIVHGTTPNVTKAKAYALPEETEEGVILKKSYYNSNSKRYTFTLTIEGLRYLFYEFENITTEQNSGPIKSYAKKSGPIFQTNRNHELDILMLPSRVSNVLNESINAISGLSYIPRSQDKRERLSSPETENLPIVVQRSTLMVIFPTFLKSFGITTNISVEETIAKIKNFIPNFNEGRDADFFHQELSYYFTFNGFLKIFKYLSSDNNLNLSLYNGSYKAIISSIISKDFIEYLPQEFPFSDEELFKFFTLIVEAYELDIYAPQTILRGISEIFNANLNESGEIVFANRRRFVAGTALLTEDAIRKGNRIIFERSQNYIAYIKSQFVKTELLKIAKENPNISASRGIRALGQSYIAGLKNPLLADTPEFQEMIATIEKFAVILESEFYINMTLKDFISEILENRFRKLSLWKEVNLQKTIESLTIPIEDNKDILNALIDAKLPDYLYIINHEGTFVFTSLFINQFVALLNEYKSEYPNTPIGYQDLLGIFKKIKSNTRRTGRARETEVAIVQTVEPLDIIDPELVTPTTSTSLMDDIFDNPTKQNYDYLNLILTSSAQNYIRILSNVVRADFNNKKDPIRGITSAVFSLNPEATEILGVREAYSGIILELKDILSKPKNIKVKDAIRIMNLVNCIAKDLLADSSKLEANVKRAIALDIETICELGNFISSIQSNEIRAEIENLTLAHLAGEWSVETSSLVGGAIGLTLEEQEDFEMEYIPPESESEFTIEEIEDDNPRIQLLNNISTSRAIGQMFQQNHRGIQHSMLIKPEEMNSFAQGFINDEGVDEQLRHLADFFDQNINNLAQWIYQLGQEQSNTYYTCLAIILFNYTDIDQAITEINPFEEKKTPEQAIKASDIINNHESFNEVVRQYLFQQNLEPDAYIQKILVNLAKFFNTQQTGIAPSYIRRDISGNLDPRRRNYPKIGYVGFSVVSRDYYRCMFVKTTVKIGNKDIVQTFFVGIGHPRDIGDENHAKRARMIDNFLQNNYESIIEDAIDIASEA